MATQATAARIAAIPVQEAMHAGVFACDRDAQLVDVAAVMAREHVHCVVVESGSGEDGPLWGVVSDLDLVAASTVRDLADQHAGGSAASPLVMVSPDESLERAAQLMTEHGTAHLVVVDRTTLRPVGVLSTLDIARFLSKEAER